MISRRMWVFSYCYSEEDSLQKDGWDGNEHDGVAKWTFAGSLFYSIVIVTTIGYGDQTPKTSWGKVGLMSALAIM